MIRERNRQDIIGNILLSCKYIQNSKKIILKYILFLVIYSILIVPSLAVSTHTNQSGIPENQTCVECHTSHQTMNIPSESSRISIAPVSKSNIIQSLAATNVAGNITLISSLGQNWYQQGIYGPNSSNDSSWGWTFFDENPSSGFITPPGNVTQRQNIYALLLDDGNNSNPISGAIVVANVTYWTYDNVSYNNPSVPVQLIEDTNRKGFYNGTFNFYGGTSYYGYTMGDCDGCHSSIYGFKDTEIGYFPGNYSVSIRAEADGKIKYTNLNFEVTPWGCEDCHGSGNQHRASADMDSACYICHGINTISGMSDAGNPHMNTAHRDIGCQDCHTNKTLSSQTFDGVKFIQGGINNTRSVPKYKNTTIPLIGGTHSAVACTDCHNSLSLPAPQGGYGSYSVSGIVNSYNPSFAGLEQFEDYYVINVESSDPLSISFDWSSSENLGFYLYPPDFDPKNGIMPPYYDGATPKYDGDTSNKPEIYLNSAPQPGKWVLQVYGYDLKYDFPYWNSWGGILQPPINYTVTSTHPIQKKELPSTPECNNCHYSGSSKADTKYVIPDWNPGFAHVDINKDGSMDVQCRMCHDAMHNITIKKCQTCHTKPPTSHPISDPSFSQYNQSQCLACHGDPHKVTMAGGGCTGCHSSPGTRYYVNTSLFAGHANLNTSDGANNVTDADCMTCHFRSSDIIMSPDAGLGAANHNNTWFCDDCHTTGGLGPIKPTNPGLMKDGTSHGSADCKWCHIAGDPLPRPLDSTLRFHPNGPKGTASGKDCLSCHYYANLPDLPFHAPGEGHSSDIGQCSEGCHEQTDNHGVNPLNSNTPPTISGLTATTPVFAGSPVQVQATVNEDQTQIAAAQYQVKKGSTIVKDWTYMTPIDGRFNSLSELVNASIDSSAFLGTYTVNIKGMASAPKTDGGPYYPLNGQWSGVYTTAFIVKQPEGYDNGTVYGSLGIKLAGAIVSIDTGMSTTTNETGFYSLSLVNGTYHLTASKEPEYYPNSSVIVTVTALTTMTQDIILTAKPIGTINGKVNMEGEI